MKFLISTIEEQDGRLWIDAAPEGHPFEWVSPQAMGQLAGETPLVWLYHAPWRQITQEVGLTAMLDNWCFHQRRALRLRQQAGQGMLFVNTAHTFPADVLAVLGFVVGPSIPITSACRHEPPEAMVLAHGLQAAKPAVWELFEALESAAFMPQGIEPQFRHNLPTLTIVQLQEVLDAAESARMANQLREDKLTVEVSAAKAETQVQSLQLQIAALMAQLNTAERACESANQAHLAAFARQAEESTARRKEMEQTKASLSARFAELAQLTGMLEDGERARQTLEGKISQQASELALLKNRGTRALISQAIALPRKLFEPASSAKKRLKEDIRLVAESSLFDAEWYLTTYPDVAVAQADPATHYVRFGGAEGRNPSVHFNSLNYLANYPDVVAAGQNPLVHYLRFGKVEKRSIQSIEN